MVERAIRGSNATLPPFSADRGSRVPISFARSLIKRRGFQAGIPKRAHAHGLGHTHVYALMMENVPIGAIERQLRGSALSSTGIYLSHIAPKEVVDAISGREWKL